MTALVLALALAAALGLIAVAFNHCYARLALVELALNEGLPPGHQSQELNSSDSGSDVGELLDPGLHIFLSRTCHACQRLTDELAEVDLTIDAEIRLVFVDRARPIAHQAAERAGASLTEHQAELATAVAADPLPFTIAMGDHGLVRRAVTPTVSNVLSAARDAGIEADRRVSA